MHEPTADLIAAAPGAPDAHAAGDAIQVVLRVRPRNAREASLGGAICVQPQGPSQLRLGAPADPHSFAFDHVADESASQQELFEMAGRPIVANCLKGFNGCLLAYGQTGSGKTHTMLGTLGAEEGLIPRAVRQVFDTAAAAEEGGWRYEIKAAMLGEQRREKAARSPLTGMWRAV